jgi:fucose permease
VSVAYATFVLGGFTAGQLIHRTGIRATLVLAGLVFVLVALATATRPPFLVFVLLGLPGGYGAGLLESALNVGLAGLPRATTLLNRLHAFFGVGALIGPVLAARILLGWSWPVIWLVLAVLAVPLLAWLAAAHPAHERPVEEPGTAPRKGLLAGTVRQPAVLLAAVLLSTYVGLEVSIGTWAFSYLVADREQSDLLAGNLVSGYWLGLTLGRFLIAPAAARLRWSQALTMSVCLAGVLVASLLVWAGPGTAAAAAGLGLAGFFLGPVFPTVMAAVPLLTEPQRVPTAIGVLNGVSVVGGSALPWLAGVLTDRSGLWTLWPYAIVLAAGQLAIWRLLGRRLSGRAGPVR